MVNHSSGLKMTATKLLARRLTKSEPRKVDLCISL